MPALGLKAYQDVVKTTTTGRNLEAAVLTKAARLLILCQEQWKEEGHFQRLDEALIFNQKVWTIFQDELAKEDHPMPAELRANILKLSLMIDKRIVEVMGNDSSPDRLELIININNNIAAGLRGSGVLAPVR